MREVRNARVDLTALGFEGHGVLTATLNLSGPGWAQTFGGFAFGGHDSETPAQAVAFRTFVIGVLRLFEVERWEDLKGKFCRIDADHARVYRLGRLLEDVWFDPDAAINGRR